MFAPSWCASFCTSGGSSWARRVTLPGLLPETARTPAMTPTLRLDLQTAIAGLPAAAAGDARTALLLRPERRPVRPGARLLAGHGEEPDRQGARHPAPDAGPAHCAGSGRPARRDCTADAVATGRQCDHAGDQSSASYSSKLADGRPAARPQSASQRPCRRGGSLLRWRRARIAGTPVLAAAAVHGGRADRRVPDRHVRLDVTISTRRVSRPGKPSAPGRFNPLIPVCVVRLAARPANRLSRAATSPTAGFPERVRRQRTSGGGCRPTPPGVCHLAGNPELVDVRAVLGCRAVLRSLAGRAPAVDGVPGILGQPWDPVAAAQASGRGLEVRTQLAGPQLSGVASSRQSSRTLIRIASGVSIRRQ